VSSQGKLEKSVLGFKAAHPSWQPQDQTTSLYLSRMVEEPAVYARSSAAGGRRGVRSRLGKSSRRSNPSVLTSPIREDEDDGEESKSGPGYTAGGGPIPAFLKSPTLANETGLGGESYVSSMRPVAQQAQAPEAGDEYISGDFKPSMMDLLREGTQKRW
jgi:hypothetical protein